MSPLYNLIDWSVVCVHHGQNAKVQDLLNKHKVFVRFIRNLGFFFKSIPTSVVQDSNTDTHVLMFKHIRNLKDE